MAKTDDAALREQLVALLKGGQAHATWSDAVAQFPADRIGERPRAALFRMATVEHIRITLHDLLEFATNSEYVEMDWPSGYWPRMPCRERRILECDGESHSGRYEEL